MVFLDKEAENVLKECLDQATSFPAILAKKLEGLSSSDDEHLRGIIKELREGGYISNLRWADNVPYYGRIEQKGYLYFKNKEIFIRGVLRQDPYFSLLSEESEKQLLSLIASDDPAPLVQGDIEIRRIIDDLCKKDYLSLGPKGFSDFFDGTFCAIVRVTLKGKNYFVDKEKRIEEILLLENTVATPLVQQRRIQRKGKDERMNNKVFIVHGHDNAAKQETARTIEKMGFEAIILHEQADSGKTIIEKIETYTDVSFAVVLYTECDLGRAKNDSVENEHFRARQNVVFEHGYLIGKLGREKVCALVKGTVETPGDISGVVYTKMDSEGAWKLQMAKNMKAAGLYVDYNQLV